MRCVWDAEVQGSNPCIPTKFLTKEDSMTCRGYDPKAVKVGKLVKIAAATILDPHKRGAFFRSYAKIAQEGLRSYSGGKGDKK